MDALVLQCGGPTAVVNRSLAALVRRWRECAPGRTLHGGHQGLRALTTGDWRSLEEVSDDWLAAVETSPGMALGGGRDRLTAPELDDGLARLATRGIHTLFLIGGNGTIAAGHALSLRPSRAPLRLIVIPKTIDNDIPETDVCPGFPSAARFLVASVRDIGADAASMRGYEDVVLMETMGRHAGWLAAATALARSHAGDAPHLMLVPEVPFDEASFLAAVRNQHARTGIAVVTVAEGVRDAAGAFLAGRMADALVERDAAGQVIFGRSSGPSPYVAALVRERLGLRCRVVRPDLLQRCSQAHVSDLDRTLAALAGAAAADAAAPDGGAAVMIGLRLAGARWTTEVVPLEQVRGERTVPASTLKDPTCLVALLA